MRKFWEKTGSIWTKQIGANTFFIRILKHLQNAWLQAKNVFSRQFSKSAVGLICIKLDLRDRKCMGTDISVLMRLYTPRVSG